MPTRVFFLDNEILIDTIPTPFVAGSLAARMNGDDVEIGRAESDFVFTSIRWGDVAARDGSTFAGPDAATAYVTGQLSMRRPVGETFGAPLVAGVPLIRGTPVAISRATGQLLPARADTYALAFVAGVASADTAEGFTDQPAHGAVTMSDWTVVTGAAQLVVGMPYFLAPAGGLTTASVGPGSTCVTRVGFAASVTTLVVEPSPPILL